MSGLVKADADVSLDAGSQVDLGLEVELDADEEGSGLLVAVLIGGTLEELACREFVSSGSRGCREVSVTYRQAERDRWRWAEEQRTAAWRHGVRHGPGHQSRSQTGKGWSWRGWMS